MKAAPATSGSRETVFSYEVCLPSSSILVSQGFGLLSENGRRRRRASEFGNARGSGHDEVNDFPAEGIQGTLAV